MKELLTSDARVKCPDCYNADGSPRMTNLVGRCPRCKGTGEILTSKDRVSDGDLATLIKGFRGLLALRDQEDDNILAALVELQERRSSETPRSLTNEEVRTLFSPLSAEEAEGFRQSGVGYPDETCDAPSSAFRDVINERARQVAKEGWTREHDDAHSNFELSAAAASYALRAPLPHDQGDLGVPMQWPWSQEWWKPTNPRRDLVKAAALILAEIERLDRRSLKACEPHPLTTPLPTNEARRYRDCGERERRLMRKEAHSPAKQSNGHLAPDERIGPNVPAMVAQFPLECRVYFRGYSYKYMTCSNEGCKLEYWRRYVSNNKSHDAPEVDPRGNCCSAACTKQYQRRLKNARQRRYNTKLAAIKAAAELIAVKKALKQKPPKHARMIHKPRKPVIDSDGTVWLANRKPSKTPRRRA